LIRFSNILHCSILSTQLIVNSVSNRKCTIVTDHIDTFTEDGILLQSGKELKADLVVSATGLVLKIAGGMIVKLDGQVQDLSKLINYKGLMIQNLPNVVAIMGYTNASWTLKADLVCAYTCRLINYMDKKGYQSCVPKLNETDLEAEPIIDFTSGYIQRSIDKLPKQGNKFPWKLHQNYIKDMIILKYRKVNDEHLVFK